MLVSNKKGFQTFLIFLNMMCTWLKMQWLIFRKFRLKMGIHSIAARGNRTACKYYLISTPPPFDIGCQCCSKGRFLSPWDGVYMLEHQFFTKNKFSIQSFMKQQLCVDAWKNTRARTAILHDVCNCIIMGLPAEKATLNGCVINSGTKSTIETQQDIVFSLF